MEKTINNLLCALIFSALAASVAAMNSPVPVTDVARAYVSGKVMILGGSQPVEDAVVEIAGNTGGAASSAADGTYRLAVTPGETKLSFSAYGFAAKSLHVDAKAGKEVKLNAYLDQVDFVSDEIVVLAKKEKNDVVTTTIDNKEMQKIPGTAGDALRAVQSMPGVASLSDYSSGLAVQGGGPDDNLYLLDSIPWPIPFHFGGILSTVYSDLLSSVDLNTAGFGAQWGDVMGAVLDAKTRPGDKDGFHGQADLSMITSQLLLEGPLGIGDASIAVYGRRSYIDLLIGKMMQSHGFTAFPYFWDIGGTLDFSIDKDNHFKGLALSTDDALKLDIDQTGNTDTVYSGNFDMDNSSFTGGFSWVNTAIAGVTSKLTSYYYDISQKEIVGTDFNINIGQGNLGLKEELDWEAGEFFGVKHDIGFGADIERIHDDADVELSFDPIHHIAEPISTYVDGWHTSRGGYLQDRMTLLPSLDLTAGIRYDKDDAIARDTTLPRFCLSWQSDELTVWKAAWGVYSQFPTDVELNREFGNPDLTANLAQHTVVSVERKLSHEISLRLDAYYKYYMNLVEQNSDTGLYDNSGSGSSKGVEAYLDANFGDKFFGWISYALSKSERLIPPDGWELYQYDQTNIATVVASYNFTPAWSVGLKLHYNTGPLVKQLTGRREDANFIWHGIYSAGYGERLADYLRVDLRTDYEFRYEGWKLKVYVEILNLLDRPNPLQIMYSDDYTSSQVIDNLPFIPYLGVEAEF